MQMEYACSNKSFYQNEKANKSTKYVGTHVHIEASSGISFVLPIHIIF